MRETAGTLLCARGLQSWGWGGGGMRAGERRKMEAISHCSTQRCLRHNILAGKSHIAVIYAAEFASRYEGSRAACVCVFIACVCARLLEVRGHVYKISPIKRVAWRDECLLALQTGRFFFLCWFFCWSGLFLLGLRLSFLFVRHRPATRACRESGWRR